MWKPYTSRPPKPSARAPSSTIPGRSARGGRRQATGTLEPAIIGKPSVARLVVHPRGARPIVGEMLVVVDRHAPPRAAEDLDDLLEKPAPGIELLPLRVERIVAMLANQDHAIDGQRTVGPPTPSAAAGVSKIGIPYRAARPRPISVAGNCSIARLTTDACGWCVRPRMA